MILWRYLEIAQRGDAVKVEAKPKIAYILTPISFGGSERVSLNYLKHADRDSFDIYPILLTRPWEQDPFFAREISNLGYSYVNVSVAMRASRDPLRVLRAFTKIFLYARKNSFDLIHTHGYFADICGLTVARFLRVPSISTCHGYIGTDAKLRFYNRLDVVALRLSRRVFCVSSEISNLLIECGIPIHNIRVIRNAVEVNCKGERVKTLREATRRIFGIRDTEILLGFSGRLSVEKGIPVLLEALAALIYEGLPVKLMIIGDGSERSNIDNLVTSKGLKERVVFTGFREDAQELLSALDFFILPSFTEGTPMALLEAMAWGLPVVATAVGEIPAIVSTGKNGILVLPGKADEIVHAIINLLKNQELKERISHAAYATIESQFGLTQWVQEVERNYWELLSNRNAT